MYAFITKGYTVGHTLTRRALRFVTGIPGFVLDAVFVAPLWLPHYEDYWRDTGFQYADGVRESGFLRSISGWIGELIGYPIGALLGVTLGFALYIPDRIMVGFSWAYHAIMIEGVADFAKSIAKRTYFEGFLYDAPEHSYRKIAWNVSVGTLGLFFGASLYTAARVVEFFLPIGNRLSNSAWKLGLGLGGAVGSAIAIPYYPIHKITTSIIDLYDSFRKTVRFGFAFLYVKTDQEPIQNGDHNCMLATHSNEFREDVNQIKRTTTTDLLYGPLIQAERKEAKSSVPPPDNLEEYLQDPVTYERMKDPVITQCGHTFERSTIRRLIDDRKPCPLDRKVVTLNELRPNTLVKSIAEAKFRR